MPRPPANISRFKRIEIGLRDCANIHNKLLSTIASSKMVAGRTSEELAALTAIEVEIRDALLLIRSSHHRLFEMAPPPE